MRTLRGIGGLCRHREAFAPARRQNAHCWCADRTFRECGKKRSQVRRRHVVRKDRRDTSFHEDALGERSERLKLRSRIGGKAFLLLLQVPYLAYPLQDFVHNPLGGERCRGTTAGKEPCFKRRSRTFAGELVLLEQVGDGLRVVKTRAEQDFWHKAANLGSPGVERGHIDG